MTLKKSLTDQLTVKPTNKSSEKTLQQSLMDQPTEQLTNDKTPSHTCISSHSACTQLIFTSCYNPTKCMSPGSAYPLLFTSVSCSPSTIPPNRSKIKVKYPFNFIFILIVISTIICILLRPLFIAFGPPLYPHPAPTAAAADQSAWSIVSGPSNPHDPGPSAANRSSLRTLGCILSGPLKPHDTGPSVAIAGRTDLPDFRSPQPNSMLEASAQAMLEVPAHPANITWSINALLWTPNFIAPGPLNPHDPGPSTANAMQVAPAQALQAPAHPAFTIWSTSALLWTPNFIAPGPSNPHDPGPSTTVGDHIAFSYFYIILSVSAIYALTDFLCIPPRSPSSTSVVFCILSV